MELEKLEEKLDALMVKQQELAIAMVENTASLKEHMAQTIEVRKQTIMIFEGLQALKKEVDIRVTPFETFMSNLKFLGFFLGILGSLAVGASQLGLLHFFKG